MMPDTSRIIGTLVVASALLSASAALASPAPQATQQPSQQPAQGKDAGKDAGKDSTKQAPPSKTAPPQPTRPGQPGQTSVGVQPPTDYIIGPDDALTIVFWREKDLSGDVVVRPDGKISLPLLNDVQASGLTPDQLREALVQSASRFVTDPSVTIMVKQINSRKVYVTGQVNKPGPFALTDNMTVLQMLALAGGLQEWADADHILVMRTEQGQTKSFKFNYKDVRKGKNLQQNILLKPGDTIVVP
jgi:polysaccharide export outer membrane protein